MNGLRTIPDTKVIRLGKGFYGSSKLHFLDNIEINFMSVSAYCVLSQEKFFEKEAT